MGCQCNLNDSTTSLLTNTVYPSSSGPPKGGELSEYIDSADTGVEDRPRQGKRQRQRRRKLKSLIANMLIIHILSSAILPMDKFVDLFYFIKNLSRGDWPVSGLVTGVSEPCYGCRHVNTVFIPFIK